MIRILLLPVYIILLAVRLVIDMMLRLSAWIFYAIAGLFLLTTICCYYMQLESAENIRSLLISCGMLLIIPQGASIIAGILEVTTEIVGDRMRSASKKG